MIPGVDLPLQDAAPEGKIGRTPLIIESIGDRLNSDQRVGVTEVGGTGRVNWTGIFSGGDMIAPTTESCGDWTGNRPLTAMYTARDINCCLLNAFAQSAPGPRDAPPDGVPEYERNTEKCYERTNT